MGTISSPCPTCAGAKGRESCPMCKGQGFVIREVPQDTPQKNPSGAAEHDERGDEK